jgi:hypothetical protein
MAIGMRRCRQNSSVDHKVIGSEIASPREVSFICHLRADAVNWRVVAIYKYARAAKKFHQIGLILEHPVLGAPAL